MDTQTQLIQQLNLERFTTEEQQRVIEEYQMQIGEALTKDLSPDQLAEYQRIINGDQGTIDWWLQQNDPEYQDTIAYKALSEGYDQDPDKVPADKVYASLAWVQHNANNIDETVARIQAQVKENADQYI